MHSSSKSKFLKVPITFKKRNARKSVTQGIIKLYPCPYNELEEKSCRQKSVCCPEEENSNFHCDIDICHEYFIFPSQSKQCKETPSKISLESPIQKMAKFE